MTRSGILIQCNFFAFFDNLTLNAVIELSFIFLHTRINDMFFCKSIRVYRETNAIEIIGC